MRANAHRRGGVLLGASLEAISKEGNNAFALALLGGHAALCALLEV